MIQSNHGRSSGTKLTVAHCCSVASIIGRMDAFIMGSVAADVYHMELADEVPMLALSHCKRPNQRLPGSRTTVECRAKQARHTVFLPPDRGPKQATEHICLEPRNQWKGPQQIENRRVMLDDANLTGGVFANAHVALVITQSGQPFCVITR